MLARRLRTLRLEEWSGVTVTQPQLAKALGVSVPSVSSWESPHNPQPPPKARLVDYARFFATTRSLNGGRPKLVGDDELTADERGRREEREDMLLALRAEVDERPVSESASRFAPPLSESVATGPLHFTDARPVTIVCASLPRDRLERMPYTDPREPDYTELYTYTDLDALVELHGHVRAANPNIPVRIRSVTGLKRDDYTTHLILLGGVDWNALTRDLLRELAVPVAQETREDDLDGGSFEVIDGELRRSFRPQLHDVGGRKELVEDVAHIFRVRNPYNWRRTVTIFNGMFGRGTYGAVRALTDASFRDRNAEYLDQRFPDGETFSILARVRIRGGEVLTPDLTVAETRLHEWPEAGA
jgi:transcriptional regulator with XRE-family HTH domain